MRLVYVGYPYTDDPVKRTAEVKLLVQALLAVRHDIIPFVPHLAFDMIFNLPEGYSNFYVLEWELEVISRCDAVCFPDPVTPAKSLCGVLWERAFSRWSGVPEVEYDALLDCEEKTL